MFDGPKNDDDFEGFGLSSEKIQVVEMLQYVKGMNN